MEIERKFLVTSDAWQSNASSATRMRQGYLSTGSLTVRARVAGDQAWLTLKGATEGITRVEREYPIPVDEAEHLLEHNVTGAVIDKTRHRVPHGDQEWEVDVFHGDNEGLVVAEIELSAEDETVDIPDWAGAEISHDRRYRNGRLATAPYAGWPDEF
ncbi:MAG: CYTH domain-containing protein [Acidobacteria bacterium]|nr:CYTH domain-containing protein [Acidobacteriota bacterium]